MNRSPLRPYIQYCAKLRSTSLLRQLPRTLHFKYDFSSNDYLGLSQDPSLIQAAADAAERYGTGATTSRVVACRHREITELETQIAKTKQSQNALVFVSGYQANISVISALLDCSALKVPPLVFSDRLNHASMHAGCQLAKAKQLRYRHLDYDHLAWGLAKTKSLKQPRFILTESVFGMDGDVANLDILVRLAKQYQAFLYVDEAHATGLFGNKGYGFTTDYGHDIDLKMGTFSKALGGLGAYVACNTALKRYLVNKANGFIYSTAPSPIQIGIMQKAWELIPSLQPKATKLLQTAKTLRHTLQTLGLNTGNSSTHIIPLIVKHPDATLQAQRYLAKQQIRVSAIRPPSVPLAESRLRIALNVNHDEAAIHALTTAISAYFT